MEASTAMECFSNKDTSGFISHFSKNAEEKETEVITIDQAGLPEMMEKMLETYDGGSIVITKDPRFADYNLTAVFDEPGTHIWDPAAG